MHHYRCRDRVAVILAAGGARGPRDRRRSTVPIRHAKEDEQVKALAHIGSCIRPARLGDTGGGAADLSSPAARRQNPGVRGVRRPTAARRRPFRCSDGLPLRRLSPGAQGAATSTISIAAGLMPRRSGARRAACCSQERSPNELIAAEPKPSECRLAQAAYARRRWRPTARAMRSRTASSARLPTRRADLFKTEVGSDAEAQAMKALDTAVQLCSRGHPPFQSNVEGLRAILATAAFRNVAPVDRRGEEVDAQGHRRRRRARGSAGRDRAPGVRAGRQGNPALLLPRAAVDRRQLPDVPGRGRAGAAQAAGELRAARRRRPDDPHRHARWSRRRARG